ncbi:DUF171-domain-containing protein [Lophiostoma macrostomum CBS 122681]|uniref:DUF171-domain-containing protein n=1 Tax=Lophiostoma macrostomum CBS 122681 TaxID=1314788 RepID=A0A6A6TGV0_9PLEO|nr:DUF171-domain-containing protein [Lophiostoma macrostomum CBS 122681]
MGSTMAKSSPNTAKPEKGGKKRKLSAVVIHQKAQEEANDDSVWDVEAQIEAENAKAQPKPPHPFKRARKESEQDTTKPNHTSKRTPREGSLDTTKPSAVFKPKRGRDWTLSLAVPGSFIANTKVIKQKNDLASRIARAAAVFCVDEVVVFDDAPNEISPNVYVGKNDTRSKSEILADLAPDKEPWENPDQFLYHVLSYLECPAHLKTRLFPEHPNLAGAGALPPLDMPHSMKANEWCQYRDGVTLPTTSTASKKKGSTPAPQYTMIECGLPYPVRIDYAIPPNVRITLKFADSAPPENWPHLSQDEVADLRVEPVESSAPRKEAGYYWGFITRKAESLSAVYTECPLSSGYDFSIGTSERGVPLSDILPGSTARTKGPSGETMMKLPSDFKHLLLVIGGVTGLETAVESDPALKQRGLGKETAYDAFDAWVNLVPGQGSRTIRTEEAVWVGLMGVHQYVSSRT